MKIEKFQAHHINNFPQKHFTNKNLCPQGFEEFSDARFSSKAQEDVARAIRGITEALELSRSPINSAVDSWRVFLALN